MIFKVILWLFIIGAIGGLLTIVFREYILPLCSFILKHCLMGIIVGILAFLGAWFCGADNIFGLIPFWAGFIVGEATWFGILLARR